MPAEDVFDPAAGRSLQPPPTLLRAIESTHNPSQLLAIRTCLCGRGVTLIQGPPGTGKTKTILGILSVLLASESSRPVRPSLLATLGIPSVSPLTDLAILGIPSVSPLTDLTILGILAVLLAGARREWRHRRRRACLAV